MQQVYLHIGFHKTASTYFQKKVWPKLEGFNYINWGLDYNKSYLKFAHENPMAFEKKYYLNIFKKELSSKNNFLISEEKLSGQPSYRYLNNQNLLNQLNQVFPNAKYIVFIRNQFDLSISLYKQYIKEGGWKSIEEYFGFVNGKFIENHSVLSENFNLSMLRFDKYFEYLLTLIPLENLKIVQYEDLPNPKKYKEIFDFLEVNQYPKYTFNKINSGFNGSQINLARMINKQVASQKNRTPRIPEVKIPKIGTINKAMVKRFVSSKLAKYFLKKDFFISKDFEYEIKKYYAPLNKNLEEKSGLILNDKYY